MKLVVLAGIVACASSTKPATPGAFLLGDATIVAPPRWAVEQHADRVTFTDPDRALHVTIVANAGEWHVAIDREVETDGTVKLVVLDPPFAGGVWVVGPGPSLTIPGFPGYTFTRKP